MTSKILQITSKTNPLYRQWLSLTTAKGIKEHQQFFLMGQKLVEEFLSEPIEGFTPEYIAFEDELNIETDVKKTQLSHELFKELDVLGTHAPLLILSFQKFTEKDFTKTPKGLEIISPLGDPRNLGALTRTAVGFGAHEIILTSESSHPFLPHSIKASAGAALKINYVRTSLKISEIPLVGDNRALALHGENLSQAKLPKDLRLWVGEEGPGLKLEHAQKKQMKFINIPTQNIESLNAMVSASLAIWEWKKQN